MTFAALGADFNSSVYIYTQDSLPNTNYPPYSGVNVASSNHREGRGILRVDAVGRPLSMVGGYVTGVSNATMKGYGSGGTMSGTFTTPEGQLHQRRYGMRGILPLQLFCYGLQEISLTGL